jgi:hypothetical protein
LRYAAMLTAIGLLFGGSSGTKTADAESKKQISSAVRKDNPEPTCNKWEILKGIRFYRASMWTWEWQEGKGPSRVTKIQPEWGCAFFRWFGARSREKARLAKKSFEEWFSRTYAKWECIHSGEGSWRDPNSPYYGGLQMDISFQRSHGSVWLKLWGTADNWPVWAQLRAAEDAFHDGRGFNPWPNTARNCGLL